MVTLLESPPVAKKRRTTNCQLSVSLVELLNKVAAAKTMRTGRKVHAADVAEESPLRQYLVAEYAACAEQLGLEAKAARKEAEALRRTAPGSKAPGGPPRA